VDVVYFDFSKAFNTISHNILLGKLRKCGLGEWSVRWIENWLNGRTPAGQSRDQTQPEFMKDSSCSTNLISFYDQVTHLVDEGKVVDVIYLDFSKAFDTVSHSVLLEKLAAHGLDMCTLHWVKSGWVAEPRELW